MARGKSQNVTKNLPQKTLNKNQSEDYNKNINIKDLLDQTTKRRKPETEKSSRKPIGREQRKQ